MTPPVILLTDGFLANGSEPWKIPEMKDLPDIKPPLIKEGAEDYKLIRGLMIIWSEVGLCLAQKDLNIDSADWKRWQ